MTAHNTSTSMDGTVSDTDRARIAAEDELHVEQQRLTVRVVAGASLDATDCRMLLSMLGLTDGIVAAARPKRVIDDPSAVKRSRKRSVAA
jgi:hypothetical protein